MKVAAIAALTVALSGLAWAQDPRDNQPQPDATSGWDAFREELARIERVLAPALEIVRAKRRAEYPRAVRHLRAIAANEGWAGLDAQAWLDWTEADTQLLIAQRLFELGERDRALRLAEVVRGNEVLGPEARASVDRKLAHFREAPLPAVPPVAPDEPRVMTTAGREVPRSRALELHDPVDGRPYYLALYDPVVLRTTRDATSGRKTLLDVLAQGAPPLPAANEAAQAEEGAEGGDLVRALEGPGGD